MLASLVVALALATDKPTAVESVKRMKAATALVHPFSLRVE